MPKPKTKDELLNLSSQNFMKLHDLIDTLSPEEQQKNFPEGTMNRNIRDVLAHLHHWHLMFLEWYAIGMKGVKPDMPAKGYTWKNTPELNQDIWSKYQDTDLHVIKQQLNTSFEQLQTIILRHSNDELFEKKRYKWTGSTSLGAYLIANTSSHYDWAFRLIKKAKQNIS